MKESLYVIYSPSKDDKGIYTEFEDVLYSDRDANTKSKSTKAE